MQNVHSLTWVRVSYGVDKGHSLNTLASLGTIYEPGTFETSSGSLKLIFYKEGAKISWLQDFLQILSRLSMKRRGGVKNSKNPFNVVFEQPHREKEAGRASVLLRKNCPTYK